MNVRCLWLALEAGLLLTIGMGLTSCSSSSDPADGDIDDGTPPAAVVDLAVSSVTDTSVKLIWTASGDDGDEGTASRYELRRSDQYISPPVWDDAVIVPGVPAPQPAGTEEQFTVTGLTPEVRYFFALSVFDEEGNSGGCGNCVDALCFQEADVVFADANLEAAIREQLVLPPGPIQRSDLLALDDLDAAERGIVDLDGLEECRCLAFLRLHGNRIVDLTPLAGLTTLCDLSLAMNEIVDLGPLAGLNGLAHLWADDNAIADLSPLSGLTALTVLRLDRNAVADLGPLSGLTALEWLALESNTVADLAPLLANDGLGQGDQLYLRENPLSATALNDQIPALTARGVTVEF